MQLSPACLWSRRIGIHLQNSTSATSACTLFSSDVHVLQWLLTIIPIQNQRIPTSEVAARYTYHRRPYQGTTNSVFNYQFWPTIGKITWGETALWLRILSAGTTTLSWFLLFRLPACFLPSCFISRGLFLFDCFRGIPGLIRRYGAGIGPGGWKLGELVYPPCPSPQPR